MDQSDNDGMVSSNQSVTRGQDVQDGHEMSSSNSIDRQDEEDLSINESNWSRRILDGLKPTCESPFQLMLLSLAWNHKKLGMRIIEETKEAGLKINLDQL